MVEEDEHDDEEELSSDEEEEELDDFSGPFGETIKTIVEMGFEDKQLVTDVVNAMRGNGERAIMHLLQMQN
jgi:hypothetical protein